MPETMDDDGKEPKKSPGIPHSVEDEKLPYEDDSREYKPMRSRKPNGWLLVVAHRDTWHEFFPTPDARRIKLKPDGRELILEYSDCQVVVRGERLGLVATGITSKWLRQHRGVFLRPPRQAHEPDGAVHREHPILRPASAEAEGARPAGAETVRPVNLALTHDPPAIRKENDRIKRSSPTRR
jgi:hypothetical protein